MGNYEAPKVPDSVTQVQVPVRTAREFLTARAPIHRGHWTQEEFDTWMLTLKDFQDVLRGKIHEAQPQPGPVLLCGWDIPELAASKLEGVVDVQVVHCLFATLN